MNLMLLEATLPNLTPVSGMTPAAEWLTNTFQNFDHSILAFYHSIANGPMNFLVKCFTTLGDGGIFLIIVALILMLFKKTRKFGLGMLGGIIIGAVFTNLTIKNFVARPRPYNYLQEYRNWWIAAGQNMESEFSFPSGHTTAAAASMTPLFLFLDKKKSWLVYLFVIALGASRNYLMVHYPSDILGGIIVGCIAGLISYLIVQTLYDRICEKGRLGNFIGTFDIKEFFNRLLGNIKKSKSKARR